MTSSAEALMIVALLSASLMIEPPPAPVDLAARVSARIAEAWHVDSSAVPRALVVNGAPVRLTWARGGVQVTLDGTALNSARAGEAVRARVPGRRAALSGIAVAPGEAALAGERP